MERTNQQAILLLEDGTRFVGLAAGAGGKAFGTVVFHTGMVGYQQLLTDPANQGLLLLQTFPLIGNYGVNDADFESHKPMAAGLIAREICDNPSNYRCNGSLGDYMKKNGMVAISEIDTRQVARHIRENGEMRGVIATGSLDEAALLAELKAFEAKMAKAPKSACAIGTIGGPKLDIKLAVIDLGMSLSQIKTLVTMAELSWFTGKAEAAQICGAGADGVFLSNGGGNPNTDYEAEIELIKELLKLDIPILGIGLGHQLLAIANGMTVSKMKCGHRGANQPVYCEENGRTYITSQNHGFTVDAQSVKNARITFRNSNDKTVEGLEYGNVRSVQFIPESIESAQSTSFIYKEFFTAISKKKGSVN